MVLALQGLPPTGAPLEVDLIMRKGDTTAFIEVKARATIDDSVYAVTPYQTSRIARAANFYTARNERAAKSFCRFDIVAVPSYLWPTHIKNAFEGN
jgi:putative endonuclease